MQTRWIAECITGCMDFGRQTSAGATDTFFGAITIFAPALQRPVARRHAYSSACGECESSESRQSVRADRAGECLHDNDRALLRQRGDDPWQSLRRFPLCWGAGAQYIATDHHGEQSVRWSWDFSSIEKGKRVFPPRRMMCPKRLIVLFDKMP